MRRFNPLVVLAIVAGPMVAIACYQTFGPEMGDSHRYLVIADNLASGRGYSSSAAAPYPPEVFRPPLYPLFLAALLKLGLDIESIVAFQFILYMASAALLADAATRIHGDKLAATLMLPILALHAPIIRWTVQICSEALALPLLCTVAWLFIRQTQSPTRLGAAGLGCVTGLAFLTRTDYVLILVAIPLMSALTHRAGAAVRQSAIVALVIVAVSVPWIVRNLAVIPGARPLGVGGGMALWVRSIELTVDDAGEREQKVHGDARVRTLHDTADPQRLVVVDTDLMNEARATIPRAMPEYLLGGLWKLTYRHWVEMSDPRIPRPLAAMASLWSTGLLLAGYVGIVLLRERRGVPGLVVLIFSIAGVHALLITEARYTVPLRPILILFAAYPLARGSEALLRRYRGTRARA